MLRREDEDGERARSQAGTELTFCQAVKVDLHRLEQMEEQNRVPIPKDHQRLPHGGAVKKTH